MSLERLDFRRLHNAFGECVSEDELVTHLGPVAVRRRRDFIEAVAQLRRERDRAVARDRPRRRRPDDDGCVFEGP